MSLRTLCPEKDLRKFWGKLKSARSGIDPRFSKESENHAELLWALCVPELLRKERVDVMCRLVTALLAAAMLASVYHCVSANIEDSVTVWVMIGFAAYGLLNFMHPEESISRKYGE